MFPGRVGMMSSVSTWVFFSLFAALLGVGEFLSRRAAEAVSASLPPDERTLSPWKRRAVAVAQIGWYAVIIAATIAYWLGSEFARDALGALFVLAAIGVLLSAVSWISSRGRRYVDRVG